LEYTNITVCYIALNTHLIFLKNPLIVIFGSHGFWFSTISLYQVLQGF